MFAFALLAELLLLLVTLLLLEAFTSTPTVAPPVELELDTFPDEDTFPEEEDETFPDEEEETLPDEETATFPDELDVDDTTIPPLPPEPPVKPPKNPPPNAPPPPKPPPITAGIASPPPPGAKVGPFASSGTGAWLATVTMAGAQAAVVRVTTLRVFLVNATR